MDLSIIILNYKSKNLVKYCIKRIKETVRDLSYEIIVVDNDSRDGVGEMVAENYPDVKFIQTGSNLGFSRGNNIGIKSSQGSFVMIMNPDIFALPGAIDRMVAYMKEHSEIGLLGPQLLNGDKSVQYSCRRFLTPLSVLDRRTPLGKTKGGHRRLAEYLMTDTNHSKIREVDWLMGACQLVRKADLEKVGLLDERFFLYLEDMEWCRRFWMNNLKVVYYPEAQIIHLHEQGSATKPWAFLKLNRIVRWHISSYIKYLLKYFNNKDYGSARS